jgi:hypothetical protein
MAFEGVQIRSTRNGVSPVNGYRDDLAAGDVVGVSLTSTGGGPVAGVSSVRWEIVGRPEYSTAGGAGPEPVTLATALTASFVVDADVSGVGGTVHKDGTYVVQATINPGSAGEVRKTTVLARLSGLTIPGVGSVRNLRKMGGFEALEDTSTPSIAIGWALQALRWLELLRLGGGGGGGGGSPETLAQAYAQGASASDQTLVLTDADGGPLILDGQTAAGAFTAALILKVIAASGGAPVVVDRTGKVGVGTLAPAVPLEVATASNPATVRLNPAGVDVDFVADGTDLQVKVGGTVIAIVRGAGGVQADGGFGAGTLPPGAAFAAASGDAVAVALANTGRIRYSDTNKRWEHSEDTGPWLPFSTDVITDSISPTQPGTLHLESLSTRGFSDRTIAFVRSVGDFFRFVPTGQPGGSATPDHIVIASAAGSTGVWQRMMIPNAAWQAVTTWSYDPSNGTGLAHDENTGADDTHPLRTWGEVMRRMAGGSFASGATIRVLSDELDVNAGFFPANVVPTGTGFIGVLGVPTVIRTGTLTSGTTSLSGNTPPTIEDTSIVNSWADVDGLGTNCVSSSSIGGRLIQKVGGNVRAWIYQDLGSKKARISIPTDTAPNLLYVATNQVNFNSGDQYQVLKLPRFPGAVSTAQFTSRCLRYAQLDLGADSNGQANLQIFTLLTQLCSFRKSAIINITGGTAGSWSAPQCIFVASGQLGQLKGVGSGPIYSTWVGNGTTSLFELFSAQGNWNSLVNTFDGCQLSFNHRSTMEHTGILYFHNISGTLNMILADNQAQVIVDTVRGSGNAGAIVNVNRQQTAITIHPALNVTVSTTHPTPYVIFGLTFTANDIDVGGSVVVQGAGSAIYN